MHGVDDVHQYRVVPFLRGLFPDAVIDAIQRHVDAKRYLCATRPEYYESLSEDSQRSLKLQGGIFSKAEADQFIAEPGAADAVRLRLWDDLAKQPTLETPGLSQYMKIARRCALKA
jgi:predicted HD phosphohydrolase